VALVSHCHLCLIAVAGVEPDDSAEHLSMMQQMADGAAMDGFVCIDLPFAAIVP
jgi:hypothetical protein